MNSKVTRNIPAFLYKYRSLDNNGLMYVEQILRHDEIYFASPVDFNDPFDCIVHARFHVSDPEWDKSWERAIEKFPPKGVDKSSISPGQFARPKGKPNPDHQQRLIGALQEKVNGFGVLCFAESREDIRMWSYYASSHTGICLMFKAGINSRF